MDRLLEKSSFLVQLGTLFGPLLKVVDNPAQYNEQEKAEVVARYCAEWHSLTAAFKRFCTAEAGHNYRPQFLSLYLALQTIETNFVQGKGWDDTIRRSLTAASAAVDAVPVPRSSVILESGTPFSTYCKLRAMCEADATTSLLWIDPYFSASIFIRYLSGVRPMVPITLVAQEVGTTAGKKDKDRWSEFLDVSRLFSQERGPSQYRLVVNNKFHDRWFVCDEKRIRSLGGSAKDAGDKDYFTIANVEASPGNLQAIADHIANGTEWFGPLVPVHK